MRIRTKIFEYRRKGADKVLTLGRRTHSSSKANCDCEPFKRALVADLETDARMDRLVTGNPGNTHRLRQRRIDKDFPETVLRSARRPAFSDRLTFKPTP